MEDSNRGDADRFEFEAMASAQVGSDIRAPAWRDVRRFLPRSMGKRYNQRRLEQINQIVIHHSGNKQGIPVESVARYHCRIGWPGMGYHLYIMADGTIYLCNSLDVISYQTAKHNTRTIGICLEGKFMGTKRPTVEQTAAARSAAQFIAEALDLDQTPRLVVGHRALVKTDCPGDTWDLWKGEIKPPW